MRLEEKTRTSGKDVPPANHHAPVGHQRLLPRKKGRLSKGILSTETETDANSEAEGLTRVRDRPQGWVTRPPAMATIQQVYGDGEHGRGRRGVDREKQDRHTPRLSGRKRPLPTAAVTLKPLGGATYAEVMREARQKMPPLKQMGITSPRIRETLNGGIIEIPGEGGADKADNLALQLNKAIEGKATVLRPTAKAEALIIGIDQSVQPEDIITELVRIGGCKVGELRTGPMRPMRNNNLLSTMWIQAPTGAINKIVEEPRIVLGWSVVRTVLLRKKQIQCYKCWHVGHASARCTAQVDRSQCCFRCGKPGHVVRDCSAPPHCVICAEDDKRNSNHRMGTPGCLNFGEEIRNGNTGRR